ncbi:hypothetical protein HK098_001717 [Nowakowskiella sp. JEL0407]|nr:hypothetical protein HK098_001717 [Nowakowskiella sp. JEL0407]
MNPIAKVPPKREKKTRSKFVKPNHPPKNFEEMIAAVVFSQDLKFVEPLLAKFCQTRVTIHDIPPTEFKPQSTQYVIPYRHYHLASTCFRPKKSRSKEFPKNFVSRFLLENTTIPIDGISPAFHRRTILHRAALCDDYAFVQYLLDRGANPLLLDSKNLSPLALAVRNNSWATIHVLMKNNPRVADGKMKLLLKKVWESNVPWQKFQRRFTKIIEEKDIMDANGYVTVLEYIRNDDVEIEKHVLKALYALTPPLDRRAKRDPTRQSEPYIRLGNLLLSINPNPRITLSPPPLSKYIKKFLSDRASHLGKVLLINIAKKPDNFISRLPPEIILMIKHSL